MSMIKSDIPKLVLGLSLLLAAIALPAQEQTEVEARLKQLKQEISRLQQHLESQRQSYRQEQAALREMDLQIQAITLELRELGTEMQANQQLLASLQDEQRELLNSLGLEQEELAQQIRAAYRLGRASQLKLLLNQDDISGLSRMLAYYRYFNQSRINQINGMRTRLTALDENQRDIEATQESLEQLRAARSDNLSQQNDARQLRQQNLQALNAEIGSGQARLVELRRNREDLEILLQQLTEALSDIPEELGRNVDLNSMKGRLPKPLRGRTQFRFGDSRGGDLRWQGWLIQAAPGSDVQSVAYGRVAFADWLRGYGLLMIIDHGNGFMSLYGHNDSLLKDVGDWVNAGEVISLSGSGALAGDGLYFELRRDGQAINPASWLAR